MLITKIAQPTEPIHSYVPPVFAPPPVERRAENPVAAVTWSSPELPAQTEFLSSLQSSPTDARMAIAKESGLSLPSDWRDMSLEQFLEWASTPREKETPLVVNAHARCGAVVSSVTIDEIGVTPQRSHTDNTGRLRTVSATFDEAKDGRWFDITTRWADGRSEQTQVKDKGYAIEIW